MNLKTLINKSILKIIVFFHIIILLVGFFGLFLIFIKPFQSFFIIFFLIVMGSEIVFFVNCPLTLLEDKLKLRLNLKIDKENFINRISKKYFNFVLPDKLIMFILLSYFILSIYLFFRG